MDGYELSEGVEELEERLAELEDKMVAISHYARSLPDGMDEALTLLMLISDIAEGA